MPTGPPAESATRPHRLRRLRRLSLRLRLVLATLVIVAVALVVTAAVGTHELRQYLVRQVDQRLEQTIGRVRRSPVEIQPGTPGPDATNPGATNPGDPEPPAQPDGTTDRRGGLPNPVQFALLDTSGNVTASAGGLAASDQLPDLPQLPIADAARRAGHPFTVTDSRGSWRVLVTPLPDRSGTVVATSSLHEIDSVINRVELVDLIVGLVVLALLAAVTVTAVRVSLRPLTGVEVTAAAIAGGDLSARVPDEPPGTEVGKLAGALNTMLGRVETEVAQRQASELAARESEERMRQFVADASHELRTPLTSIRGFAELHRQGELEPPDTDHLLARIESEATRMSGLVEDLLLLARLDQRRPMERRPVDVVPIVADAAHDAHLLAPDRTVRLVLPDADDSATEEPGAVVIGDEAQLRQVVANLVSNALTHTSAGTALELRVARVERDGAPQVALEVADKGPGLSPEHAARAFERFYRADKGRSRATGGTGLGLSIVDAIVTAHGGRVELDTAPGAGATFRVVLPSASDTQGAGTLDRS